MRDSVEKLETYIANVAKPLVDVFLKTPSHDAEDRRRCDSAQCFPVGFTFDDDAKEYLGAAQRMQDRGKSWGTALVYAQDRALWYATASVRNALGLDYQCEPDRYDEKYDNLG